jgi:uncharacterized protein YqeY
MSLKTQLADDLKDAMRSGDETRKSTLRMLMTAVQNAEIAAVDVKDPDAQRQELDDTGVLGVIQKQAKQRQDSIEEFKKANRTDLADKEASELKILETYLPAMLSRDEIAAAAREVIAETGASGPADKGKVMPVIMKRLAGQADGRAINEVVTELLAGG